MLIKLLRAIRQKYFDSFMNQNQIRVIRILLLKKANKLFSDLSYSSRVKRSCVFKWKIKSFYEIYLIPCTCKAARSRVELWCQGSWKATSLSDCTSILSALINASAPTDFWYIADGRPCNIYGNEKPKPNQYECTVPCSDWCTDCDRNIAFDSHY